MQSNSGRTILIAAAVVGALVVVLGAGLFWLMKKGPPMTRAACVDGGVKAAEQYYGSLAGHWDPMLAAPAVYNPVPSGWNTTAAALRSAIQTRSFQAQHPLLFADLNEDGLDDVFLYVRDNEDEFPPAAPNFERDNDQNVLVGAICISPTLVEQSGADREPLEGEVMLSFNAPPVNRRFEPPPGPTP